MPLVTRKPRIFLSPKQTTMKILLLCLLGGAGFIFSSTGWLFSRPPAIDVNAYHQAIAKKRMTALRCAPDWSDFRLDDAEINAMPILPGTGTHRWLVSTSSDSAQQYFNQGINLYYGFHIIEALASFKKAQQFDSGCAMLYWGEALAYGPNINDGVYTAAPEAEQAVQKALDHLPAATPVEQDLIRAISTHYRADTTTGQPALNQAYAGRMQRLFEKYPNDTEVGTLYADALMNLHPWDLWEHNLTAKPWTPAIVAVLEHVLQENPDHPGANHYFIHVMEGSPTPGKANRSAQLLAALAPGLSHMVHMPSHIYIRTGEYQKGVDANTAALVSYDQYFVRFPAVSGGVFLYQYHNFHMQAACAINAGNETAAVAAAMACRKVIDTAFLALDAPMGNFVQYVYMTPLLAMITYGKWNAILSDPPVGGNHLNARLLRSFARGMAFAHLGQLKRSSACLRQIDSLLALPDLAVVMVPFNAPVSVGRVARSILSGSIAAQERNFTTAVAEFSSAVQTEDSLVYQEPRDWLIPARHYLGHVLLQQHRYVAAEKVFLDDLRYQPNNFISEAGLKKARKGIRGG